MDEHKQELDEYDVTECSPMPGDVLFAKGRFSIDCLGLFDWKNPEQRNPTGRRGLYAQGYLDAADRLVQGLVGIPSEDALIYPVLFLYRHYLELELKSLVMCASWSSKLDEEAVRQKRDKIESTHDLGKLWSLARELCPFVGRWAEEGMTKSFESMLQEISSHDQNSEAGRYPAKKQKQYLLGIHSIDLNQLQRGFHKLGGFVKDSWEHLVELRQSEREGDQTS